MILDKVIVLDIDSLPSDIISKIESGTYKIFNGVVRDESGKSIIKHIPTKIMEYSQKDLENLPELLKKVSSVNISVTAVSTGIILGALIVATKIIFNKLNEIENSINDIKKELQDQNLFQYFLQLKDYIAISESLREILKKPELIDENRDIIILKLNELSIKRNGLMLIIPERMHSTYNVSTEHKEVILKFLNNSIMILPKITYIEQQGAYAINRIHLANNIEYEFYDKYIGIEYQYKKLLNNEIHKMTKGESLLEYKTLENIKSSYKNEIEFNQLLLHETK